MKKLAIGIFVIGIILLFVPIFIVSKPKEVKREWVTIKSSEINKTLQEEKIIYGDDLYNCEEYVEKYFYDIKETKNKYFFLIPSSLYLNNFLSIINEYNGEIIVNYSDLNIKNINDYLTSIINEYEDNFDKFFIRKYVVDDETIVINIQVLESKENSYVENLVILSKNTNDNYSILNYKIFNQMFSDEFILKVINGFKKEKNKAEYTTCYEENDYYICNFIIDHEKTNINFVINEDRYKLNDKARYDNYQESFVSRENDSNIEVSFDLFNEDMNYSDYFDGYTKEEITLHDTKVTKYSLEKDVYYIVDLSSNLKYTIHIDSKIDNPDEIAIYFMDYELNNL